MDYVGVHEMKRAFIYKGMPTDPGGSFENNTTKILTMAVIKMQEKYVHRHEVTSMRVSSTNELALF